jgi:hypothetical protein
VVPGCWRFRLPPTCDQKTPPKEERAGSVVCTPKEDFFLGGGGGTHAARGRKKRGGDGEGIRISRLIMPHFIFQKKSEIFFVVFF